MLIFDQLKKDDPQLRFVAFVTLGGLGLLLAGLWWVQVVSTRYYRGQLEHQSIRDIRIPAVRGSILDRNGQPLAENIPRYNVSLYMEEMSSQYQAAYAQATNAAWQQLGKLAAAKQQELGRTLTPAERRRFTLTKTLRDQLGEEVRYQVTSNMLAQLGARLNEPVNLAEKAFDTHYSNALAIPFPVMTGLTPAQIAVFEEQSLHTPAMDLGAQSVRFYPNGNVAAHILGYLSRDTGEDATAFSYRMTDYQGVSGIEKLFDEELRGTPGGKSVLVNYKGYRQGESVYSPAEPGEDVYLTIDLDVQKVADRALATLPAKVSGAAVVVMDVRNGDIIAMASSPAYNPNYFVQRPAPDVWAAQMAQWTNGAQLNHVTQGSYEPGSIFKIVVGMAALEKGLDPKQIYTSPGYVPIAGRTTPMHDLAPAGDYDFEKALAASCNYYFVTIVTNDPRAGVLPKIIELGHRLHFGERTGLIPHQEVRGAFPTATDITARDWHIGNTANTAIGQDKVAVTPLQITVMTAAVANGGRVFYPRLVEKIQPHDSDQPSQVFPAGRLRDTLDVSPRTIQTVHDAMREDVASPQGTGHNAEVEGMDVAGKTGTAERTDQAGHKEQNEKSTWFASFAPVGDPRYAVVVMAFGGDFGGTTCAPLAKLVYEELLRKERAAAARATVAEITR